MRKIPSEFYQGEVTMIFALVIETHIYNQNLKKIGAIVSCLNGLPSLPWVARDKRKQFQFCKVV